MDDRTRDYLEGWPPEWPDITDSSVRAAIAAVPRHLFVPPAHRSEAYEDFPLPIGEGQTISQPYMVAVMTQALELTPSSRVLEIGTGSGYQAAVLAQITPHVYSVETRPGLAEIAQSLLTRLGYPVEIMVGDGCLGWPEHAPYDAVIVTAAPVEVPPALVQQLGPQGRLVIPIGQGLWDQRLWLLKKDGPRLLAWVLGEVRFVPLVGGSCEPGAEGAELAAIRRLVQKTMACA